MNDAPEQFRTLYLSFEHALKRRGYLLKRRRAEPDWLRFARELGERFFNEVRDSGDADMLISRPPGEVLNKDGVATWHVPTEPLANVTKLFTHGICQVRNNYFHGDKFVGSPEDWRRDEQLLAEATRVLRRAIDQHPVISKAIG